MEKFVDKGLFKVVKQPLGGGDIELYGRNMDLYGLLTRAAHQSARNCRKHIIRRWL